MEAATLEDITFKGREANHNLHFRQWSRSRHAQYFTNMSASNAIFTGLKSKIRDINTLKVFDPTAGSGRLLIPWKRAGAEVLGIEIEESAAKVLRHNIGSKNSRTGDLMKYAPYLDDQEFDIVLTNPPYGIVWNIENDDFQYETKRYGKTIESQSATLEIAIHSLSYEGILVAIIPTSTFQNDKDIRMVRYLHDHTTVLVRLTVDDMFKEEYGIPIQVDIVVARKGYDNDSDRQEIICDHSKSFEDISRVIGELDIEISPNHGKWETPVPDLSNLTVFPIGNLLELNVSGVSGDASAASLVDFYDETMEAYSPVLGTMTGIMDAFVSSPALMTSGPQKALDFFSRVGFKVNMPESAKARLEALKRKYDFLSLPLFPPKSPQLLAYFLDKPYKALKNVKDKEGKAVFRKGRMYAIRPAWIRNMQVVKVENVLDSKGNSVKMTTHLDRGYLSVLVKSEAGEMRYDEPDTEKIKELVETFGLPQVRTMDDAVPARIAAYRSKLEKGVPQLFDYQLHDLSRLCCKPCGYLGYEMGGGKTLSALSYCIGRGTRFNLIVCQASLVDVWVNEGRKFGILVERLTTHTAIDELLAEKKKWKGKDKKNLPMKFYVTSYEFLSLDTARVYDPWECELTNKDGKVIHSETCTTKHCSKGHSRKTVVTVCPKCQEVKLWTGDFCKVCGYQAYTYKEPRQYPAYKRLSKRFSTVIVDEAQLAKNISGRGLAVRAMKSRCKLLLSGTIQRGYVSDVYHNFSWLLGNGNPLFPYPRKGGTRKFLNEFGTFEYVSREFEDTLTTGRRKIILEVSNLNRFWRILAAFTVRRLKPEMVELPPKNRNIVFLDMDIHHRYIYNEYADWAKKAIDKELRKPDAEINMGVISTCLWALRFAATAPNDSTHLCSKGPGVCLNGTDYNKVSAVIDMVKQIADKKEKVVIFSGLRSMVWNIEQALLAKKIKMMKITASVDCTNRFKMIEEFQNNGYTALVAGLNVLNRGYTITMANHVIITDLEYQPESTDQAEDRVHRTGQTRPVNVTYFLSKDTIDESMLEIVTQKKEAIGHSINGEARYASTADLLKQMDNRRIELAVARKILNQTPAIVEVRNVMRKPVYQPELISPVFTPMEETGAWGKAVQLSLFDERC